MEFVICVVFNYCNVDTITSFQFLNPLFQVYYLGFTVIEFRGQFSIKVVSRFEFSLWIIL
jgi:hypothetical protein